MSKRLRQINQGFTLIEIMVVVSIVAILAAVIGVNALQSGQQSRDAKRQADIRTLQSAVELYKNKYGRYPEGCNTYDTWSGQIGSGYDCADGTNRYIIGANDRWFSEFMATLPLDKKLNSSVTNSGYVYMTNELGTVYKIMAMNTVEADEVLVPDNAADFSPYLHPLKSCDMRARLNSDNSTSFLSAESWCNSTARNIGFGNNAVVPHCRYDNQRFQTSYGAWGGFAPPTGSGTITSGSGANTVEAWTELIICR
jgi:prepilin-type N-terminal cleavage/methylation domain-containing protein